MYKKDENNYISRYDQKRKDNWNWNNPYSDTFLGKTESDRKKNKELLTIYCSIIEKKRRNAVSEYKYKRPPRVAVIIRKNESSKPFFPANSVLENDYRDNIKETIRQLFEESKECSFSVLYWRGGHISAMQIMKTEFNNIFIFTPDSRGPKTAIPFLNSFVKNFVPNSDNLKQNIKCFCFSFTQQTLYTCYLYALDHVLLLMKDNYLLGRLLKSNKIELNETEMKDNKNGYNIKKIDVRWAYLSFHLYLRYTHPYAAEPIDGICGGLENYPLGEQNFKNLKEKYCYISPHLRNGENSGYIPGFTQNRGKYEDYLQFPKKIPDDKDSDYNFALNRIINKLNDRSRFPYINEQTIEKLISGYFIYNLK